MWIDFVLAGVTYQKAVSKHAPFTLGPPAGFPRAETNPKLYEWRESMNCVMPAAAGLSRPSLRA
eukprot:2368922-Heterocapsa_arctica.AAC.1